MSSKSTARSIMLICGFFLLFSCSSRYIGWQIGHNHPALCNFYTLPASCAESDKNFAIEYEITGTEQTGEYKITGTATMHGGDSGTWVEYSNATFILLLVDNGVVVETVNIAGGGGSLAGEITFSRTFKTTNSFQATVMSYEMQVKG